MNRSGQRDDATSEAFSGAVRAQVEHALTHVVPARFVEPLLKRSAELARHAADKDPHRLRALVEGPLRDALRERFGEQLARLGASRVRDELGIPKRGSIPEDAGVDDHKGTPSHEGNKPTGRRTSPEALGEHIWLISEDVGAQRALSQVLGTSLAVLWRTDVTLLPRASEDEPPPPRLAVLDCRQENSAVSFDDLLHVSSVKLWLLWGSAAPHLQEAAPPLRNWIRCSDDVDAQELGMMVRAFSAGAPGTRK